VRHVRTQRLKGPHEVADLLHRAQLVERGALENLCRQLRQRIGTKIALRRALPEREVRRVWFVRISGRHR
jgi:hypothetical protein